MHLFEAHLAEITLSLVYFHHIFPTFSQQEHVHSTENISSNSYRLSSSVHSICLVQSTGKGKFFHLSKHFIMTCGSPTFLNVIQKVARWTGSFLSTSVNLYKNMVYFMLFLLNFESDTNF